MPAFTSTCRCCSERLSAADMDAAWNHFIEHSEAGHDATFRRTARTRSHAVGSAPPHAD